ncbi:MAG: 3-methyl-2-oxobutanoate hydroxymethyltransferase [Terriglobales bacterium]
MSITSPDSARRVTISSLAEKKAHRQKISSLTAYDYTSGLLVDQAGIDIILVGDSLAQVMLGYDNTLPVSMDEMLHHTRAVRRGVRRALLVADMPYGSYQISEEEAVSNAARFVKEAGAEAVKLEGGTKRFDAIRRIVDAEIPVMGHIGLTPQSVHVMGGYKVQGKTLHALEQLMKDAVALEQAGVFSIVLEGIPCEVAAMITAEVKVPTIGIGAGPDCDGQVLVLHDLLGLTPTPPAKFVRRYADVSRLIREAVGAYQHDIESGEFPRDSESYHLHKDIAAELEELNFKVSKVGIYELKS